MIIYDGKVGEGYTILWLKLRLLKNDSIYKETNLDVDKYDACIENSIQSRIYAFSWYLDIVADNWDVLVLDDYKAVMPIPWKKKYFIKYIAQPLFLSAIGCFFERKNFSRITRKNDKPHS